MLTVRLQTNAGGWLWVNVVMHIRQPFVCDNGEPAIICTNQVIQEGEAKHFKLQSQLNSAQVARSPEFLSPAFTGTPPHTISQVSAVEASSNSSNSSVGLGGGSTTQQAVQGEDTLYYHGVFFATAAGGLTPDASGTLGRGAGQETVPRSYSDTSSDGSPHSKNNPTKADVVNKLKRKLRESYQCKPSKQLKSSFPPEERQPSPTAGPYILPSFNGPQLGYDDLGLLLSSSSSAGDVQVLGPISDAPVYAQLAAKKEVLVHQSKAVALAPVAVPPVTTEPGPPGPLTPDSLTDSPAQLTTTLLEALSVEVSVPPSLLTPDASPVPSPEQCLPDMMSTIEDSDTGEQSVPVDSLADLDELSLFDTGTRQQKKPEIKTSLPQMVEDDVSVLPVLDALSLETLLTEDCCVLKEARSPESLEHQAPEDDLEQSIFDTLQKAEADRDSLQQLVDGVKTTILDLVGGQNCPTANLAELESGSLLIVPQESGLSEAQAAEIQSVLRLTTLQPSPSDGDLLDELHQLTTELADVPPSYGKHFMITACVSTLYLLV